MSVLKRLQEIFRDKATETAPVQKEDVNLACAALLVEVAQADYVDDPRETEATVAAIREVLGLEAGTVEELLTGAAVAVEKGTSLFPHTNLINDQCTREQKFAIVKAMWRVAFADGNVDKYEEHLIRRVAGLVHLDHADFIQAKIAARG